MDTRNLHLHLDIMIMSGVEDGAILNFKTQEGDGIMSADSWTITVGRKDEMDICLRTDSFVSRQHAKIHFKGEQWWLEDCNSTNGTFIENSADFFDDLPVKGIIPINNGQLFRVGRTWMRIQKNSSDH